MKKILTSFALVVASLTFAQVGINNDNPKATLDIKVKNSDSKATDVEGLLVPRVTATRALNMGEDVPESTLVYIESGAAVGSTTISEVDGKGFYYFDATKKKWIKIGSGINNQPSNGNVIRNVVVFEGSYTIKDGDYFFVQTGTAGTVTLPSNPTVGREICGYNQGSGTLGFSGGTMKGGNITLPANISSCYIYDGTNWSSTTGY